MVTAVVTRAVRSRKICFSCTHAVAYIFLTTLPRLYAADVPLLCPERDFPLEYECREETPLRRGIQVCRGSAGMRREV